MVLSVPLCRQTPVRDEIVRSKSCDCLFESFGRVKAWEGPDAWMEGSAAPFGVPDRYDAGNISFSYVSVAEMDILISMPRRTMPYGDVETRAFFSNLLFEGPQLVRTRDRRGLDINDIAGLLYQFGAIALVPCRSPLKGRDQENFRACFLMITNHNLWTGSLRSSSHFPGSGGFLMRNAVPHP